VSCAVPDTATWPTVFIINILLYKIRHLCDWEFDIALFTDLANQGIRRLVIGWLVDYMSRGTQCLCSQLQLIGLFTLRLYGNINRSVGIMIVTALAVKSTSRDNLPPPTWQGDKGITLIANIRIRDLHLTPYDRMTVQISYWIGCVSKWELPCRELA
jgi:hypothetical protein